MKQNRKIIICLALCALCVGAGAQTVTVADVEALPGETVEFSLSLADGKADTYTALQFNGQFPATGFTTTGGKKISSLWPDATAVVGDVDQTGNFTIPVSSPEKISGSDVENLLSVSFKVDESVALGSYDVTLSNIWFGYGTNSKDYAPDVTFKVNVVAAHTVILDEMSTTAPEAATGVNVRVKRTIVKDIWNTICLPFAMTEEQVKTAFGDDVELASFNDYEFDDAAGTISVKFTNATAIAANHPYIIKVSDNVTEFTVDGVDINPQEAVVDFDTDRRHRYPRKMVGTYVANTLLDWGTLFLSNNQFWYSVGDTKMNAFRAYFNFYDLLTDFEDNYQSRISMKFEDGDATGVKEVENRKSANGKYFDLQGRKIANPGKGLYIRNGKKELIK